MPRDTFFTDAAHCARAVADRALGLAAAGRSPVIVAVDGHAGSGKTTLAAQVGRLLRAPVVHMDDLYPGWDGLAQSSQLAAERVLRPLREGRDGAYRRWDWAASSWAEGAGATVTVPWAPLLVLEGCGSSVGPAGPLVDVRVWVQAPYEERMRRGIERDGEVFAQNWERWARQEEQVFAADGPPGTGGTAARADLTLDTSAPAVER